MCTYLKKGFLNLFTLYLLFEVTTALELDAEIVHDYTLKVIAKAAPSSGQSLNSRQNTAETTLEVTSVICYFIGFSESNISERARVLD